MQILKTEQYINEKLTIQPVTKDRLSKMKEGFYVGEKARQFIEENNLVWNQKKMCYDCEGDVDISKNVVIGGKLKIRFGKVGGHFDCSYSKLTSLEGAPNEVGGDFYCSGNYLTTLEGAPQYIDGGFCCSHNNITTLEGAPKKVGDDFDCSYNKLTTLEGAPNEVGGDFYCSFNELTSLEGAPNVVGRYFNCSGNPNLVLPKEKPSWVKGKIIS